MSNNENNAAAAGGNIVRASRVQGGAVKRRALSVLNQSGLLLGQNKRGLSEKNVVNAKIGAPPVNRPMTRQYAAQLEKVADAEELKRVKPTVPNTNDFGDCIFIDAGEELQASSEQPVPMLSSDSDENSTEADLMDEDLDEKDPIVDIDGCDAGNPLAVIEYVKDLYANYKKMEIHSCVPLDYMLQQVDVNEKMRAILIDWLIEVHDKFDLMRQTLFLTVNIIDRFLAQQEVGRKRLQLVGLVALLLACKYEEVSCPVVSDLIIISDRAYTRQDILDMEKLMLNTLRFNMSLPTAYVFMKRFLKAAQSDKKLEVMAFFLIELALVEYGMLKYPPSLLAAAAVYTAHCTIYGFRQWSKTCEWHSSFSEDGLLECAKLIVGLHKKAATGKLTGVHRKYCTLKFGYIAKYDPALFLLDTHL